MNNAERQHSPTSTEDDGKSAIEQQLARANVDNDPVAANQRLFTGPRNLVIALMCVAYTVFHLLVMNVYPLETWAYRLTHVGGGLLLGFLLFGSQAFREDAEATQREGLLSKALLALAGAGVVYGLIGVAAVWINGAVLGERLPPQWAMSTFGIPLTAGTALAILHGWVFPHRGRMRFAPGDVLLALSAIAFTACTLARQFN